MKTLKKTLCLVLAVVMVVGVLVLPASADYKDVKDIDEDYAAAVTSLTTWKIMEGENNNFKPEASIQRQEMAAIVYRMLTGDVKDADGKDNSAIYAPYAAKFTDVDTKGWAAGYIGYCVNKGIILGTNAEGTTFEPARAIPAVDVLAMLLRCLGYTQKDEFTGANWSQKVASAATRLGLTEGITRTLDKVSQRQEVAQMTYQAAAVAPRVTWSESEQNYIPYVNPNVPGSVNNDKLITETAGTATAPTQDQWGAPTGGLKAGKTVTFNYPAYPVTLKIAGAADYPALYESYTAASQCDLADVLDLTKSTAMIVYTNGKENKTTTTIDPLNTTAQIGAQGRYTAVYKNHDATTSATYPYVIVYKDTLLAKVTNVKAHTVDANGHLKTTAKLYLDVYDGKDGSAADTDVTQVVLENKTDYTWTKGQYLLVNYHQNDVNTATTKTVSSDVHPDATTEDYNKDGYNNDNVVIIQEAESFTGAQTLVSKSSNKHTIEGTAYNDNNRYVLDQAGTTMKVPFTWFKDTKGNVIGSAKIAVANSYGVITRMWASINSADGSTTVKANVTFADGTTQTVNVANVVYYTSTTAGTAITTAAANIAGGRATYTDTSAAGNVMKANSTNTAFYVSDSYNVNSAANAEGIMLKHLFKVTASSTLAGAYDFVEVAGSGADVTIATGHGVLTGLNFKGMGNDKTSITTGKAINGEVEVDNDTVFLIRSFNSSTNSYVFTSVKGFKEISNYVDGEVDYVDCDEDDAAEYVYIISGAKGAEGWHLFYAASTVTSDADGSKALVPVDDNGTNYTVYGYLDGVAGSVTIAKTQQGWNSAADTTDAVKANPALWTGDSIGAVLGDTTNGNTLWMVYIKDGRVIDINGALANRGHQTDAINQNSYYKNPNGVAFDSNPYGMQLASTVPYGQQDGAMGIYEKQSVMVVDVTADTAVNGGTIKLGNKTLTVVDPIVGSWSDLETAAKYNCTVIVVFDKNDTITQAYIYNTDDGTNYNPGKVDTTLAEKTTYTIGLQSDGKNIGSEVALYAATSKGTAADALKAALANANEVKVATFGTGDEHTFKAVASKPEQAEIAFANSTAGFTVSALTITSASEFTTKVYVGDYIVIAWAASDTTPTHFAAFKVVA